MKKYKLRVLRTKALSLLIIITIQVISPSVSWAIASDPVQVDFAGYEEANTTDMVNLNTGDFTYNIPFLNLPSPEGGFQLPLSYHAGIQLEEESSWVGLGWSLNAGAIIRNVNQFADDYQNQPLTTTMYAKGSNGYIKNRVLFQSYYDSDKGKGFTFGMGNIFKAGFGSMSGATTVLGISAPGKKVHFDALGFVGGVTEIAAIICTYGAYSAAASGAASTASAFSAVGDGLSVANTAIGIAQSMDDAMLSASRSQALANAGWKVQKDPSSTFFKTYYSYYLDVNKTEKMFGALYLNKIDDDGGTGTTTNCMSPFIHNNSPISITSSNYDFLLAKPFTANPLPVSDMHMNNDGTSDDAYLIEPTSIAYDNYGVLGGGISGDIKPYRLDAGSLAYPNLGALYNFKLDVVNFMDYKVNFKYTNDNANTYTGVLGDNADNIANPQYGFYNANDDYTVDNIAQYLACNVATVIEHNILNNGTEFIGDGAFPNWVITDKSVSSEYAANYVSNYRKEADRTGLKNNHLASGKFIQWYSNKEMLDGVAKADGFMDFLNDAQRASFRSASSLPTEGIGGFMITREDGMTYHYSLPAYNNYIDNYINGASGLSVKLSNPNKFAYDWLLTGITGPDFVDRGTIGVIDDADYGYWVKMDYGKFASNFAWRSPYFGEHYSPSSLDDRTLSAGSLETYYLNRISTKTHSALFVKSVKSDGKSVYSTYNGSDPSSSLKLDDVVILTNADYAKLTTATGSGGAGLAANFNSGQGNTTIKNGDVFDNVLDNFDVNTPAIQSFLTTNQIRKIHFNYSYNLCPRTYNSFDFLPGGGTPAYRPDLYSTMDINLRKGKLTLESLDMYGPNNFKTIPSFIFGYGDTNNPTENPTYYHEKWDGWGMYSSTAGYNTSSHSPTSEGSQWCLKKIITPDGAEVNVSYERDTYSSVNGESVGESWVNGTLNTSNNTITLNEAFYKTYLKVGDKISINAQITDYVYAKVECDVDPIHCCCKYVWNDTYRNMTAQVTITAINGDVLTVSPILNSLDITSLTKPASPSAGSSYSNFTYKLSTAIKYLYGGDVRVKEIGIKGEDGSMLRTKYVYSKDGTDNSVTSGVCSFEPEFCRYKDFYFYKFYDQPATPILYSKVTVFSNISSTDNTYLNKTEYSFVTPDQNQLTFNRRMIEDRELRSEIVEFHSLKPHHYCTLRSKMYHMIFRDYTSRIRSIQSIKEWNNKNQLLKETTFKYTDNSTNDIPNKQGIYGESTIFSDRSGVRDNERDVSIYFRLNRTSKIKYPYILKEIDVTTNGQTVATQSQDFDFITGQATTSVTIDPYGVVQTRKTIPAYKQYPNMGSKIIDITNKNMLAQTTAVTDYISVNGESNKPVAASVQTWKNGWSYRELISSNYTDDPQTDIWRPYQTYSWKSDVNKDGTIPSFTDFVWSGTLNPAWQKENEITRYDHYSQAIESKNINNMYSAIKKGGIDRDYIIATSSTSNYQSFVHTSFEDLNNNYFGGEISLNQGAVITSYPSYILPPYTIKPHTGKYFIRIPYSSYGPTFYVKSNLQVGKTYQASVWINKNSSTAARLWITLDGAGQYLTNSIGFNDPSAVTVGDWQLLKVNLTVPSTYVHSSGPYGFNDLRVFVSTIGFGNQESFIDDMRLQPVNSTVNGYVYDEKGNMTALLNNENYATIYSYDGAGRVIKVEKETAKGLKKVSETSYHYARQ